MWVLSVCVSKQNHSGRDLKSDQAWRTPAREASMKDVVGSLGEPGERAPEPRSGESQTQSLVNDASAAEQAEMTRVQSASGFGHGKVMAL